MTKLPKSLYIHIPFCSSICDYCDFTKLQYFSFLADSYIENLIQEIESFNIAHRLETIYIGGGTPSALSMEQLDKLLSYLDKYSKECIEFTIEVNPESINEDKLKLFKKHNVNRISMGVESTNNQILKAIGRKHTFELVKEKVSLIRSCGFDNLALDLIIGLPNITEQLIEKDIKNILSLNPETISLYSLTVHENTKFYINHIKEMDDDLIRKMYDICHNFLTDKKYIHYEISCWAKKDKVSKHNLTYWRNEHYYGAGLGASGYVGRYRYINIKNLIKYNQIENKIDSKEEVTIKDDKIYEIYLNLRTDFGLDLNKYNNKFNEDLLMVESNEINNLIDHNLLILDKEKHILKATYEGMMTLDRIVLSLF